MKLHALEEMLLKMLVWPLVKLYQNHCHKGQCHREMYLIIIIIITSETRGQSTGVVISIMQYVMQILYQSCSYQWE